MRNYELMVLLHPDLEIDVDSPIKKIEKLVEVGNGKVIKRDNWGKRRTAYTVKKQDFAVYVYFELQMDPAKVGALENSLLITEEVLRHLVVSAPEMKAIKAKPAKTKVAATSKETE